jgi:CRISPR-associated protein Cmr5
MSEDKTNTISGIEQGRASFAYECANGIAKQQKEKSKLAKEYKSYAKKIPMLIKTNGLGATFAFVLSKKGKGNAYEISMITQANGFSKKILRN